MSGCRKETELMKRLIVKRRRERATPTFSPDPADEDQEAVIEGEVIWVIERKGLLARVRTEDGIIEVRIFHPTDLHRRYLERGAEIRLTGRPLRRQGRLCFVHPRIVLRPSQ